MGGGGGSTRGRSRWVAKSKGLLAAATQRGPLQVRRATVKAGSTRACARATFVLSKFLLEVSVLHFFSEERSHLKFHLDPASTNYILKEAEGMWFVDAVRSPPLSRRRRTNA